MEASLVAPASSRLWRDSVHSIGGATGRVSGSISVFGTI
jgi:hypothetical protein